MLYMSFAPSVTTFFLSIFYGAILGVFWIIFKILRKNLSNLFENLSFILDVSYCIIVSIVTLCFFFFFTYGGFRIFVIIGELLGFILFKISIERPTYIVFDFLIKIIILTAKSIFKIIRKIFFIITNFSEKNILKFSNYINKIATNKKIKKNNHYNINNNNDYNNT